MRFGRRDHESFIGGYDPEHEMPDPGRDPRERWQSDAYRRNAEDSGWPYRWNPDRFEERSELGWREPPRLDREIQPRDRYDYRTGYERGFEHGLDYARQEARERWDRERFRNRDDWDWRDNDWDRQRHMDRGGRNRY